MKKERKDHQFIKKPTYPGGLSAMRSFIKAEMKYPNQALNQRIEGTVLVKYQVDYKGNVVETRVVSGIGYGCDEEAERIVSLLKFQVPKSPRKLRVKFGKSIRIKFRLPKAAPKPAKSDQKRAKTNLSYTITTKDKSPSEPSSKSYSYTIRW